MVMFIKEWVKNLLRLMLPVRLTDLLISKYCGLEQRIAFRVKGFFFQYQDRFFKNNPGFLYPETLFIFLTTRCNLRCFICRRENFTGEDLQFENLYKLENAIKQASIIDLTGWGEPFLYPKFREVIEYISSRSCRKRVLRITTNGTLLTKDLGRLLRGHLNFLNISLNAATPDTYNREMGHGDFNKTIFAIQEFMSGLDPDDMKYLGIHFIAHAANYHEIPEFIALAKSLGIQRVGVAQYMVGTAEHESFSLLNVKEEYNHVVDKAEVLSYEMGISFHAPKFLAESGLLAPICFDPLKVCIVGVDGSVSPCCFAGSYSLGNVYKSDFDSIWFGNEYQKLRKNRHLQACRHCNPYMPLDDPSAHYSPHYKENMTASNG